MTTEISNIQSLELARYADALTAFQSKVEGYKGQVERAKAVEYNLETKPRFDQLSSNIKKAGKEFEELRKPFTRQLDDVKKLFTTIEAECLSLLAPIEEKEKAWKRTELEAQQKAREAQELEATKKRVLAEFVPKVESLLVDLKYNVKVEYLKALEEGEEPIPFTMTSDTWQGICLQAMNAIGGQSFKADLIAAIAPTKDALITEATKDIHAWQSETLKSKGNKKALAAIGRNMGLVYSQEVVATADKAAASKVEAEMAIFESAQEAKPEVVINTKFIPAPKDLKQVMEIFRYWLGTANPSVEEAVAQCSKAMTACKRDALKGVKWNGIDYIEDVK